MRKLATVQQIAEIKPIEGADKIVAYRVNGWWIVDQINRYKVNDLVVYFEIDSHLPVRPEFEFLRERSFKKMGDREGFRLKTVRLRGQISQGLILPVDMFVESFYDSKFDEGQELCEFFYVGSDISDFLDVVKYEPPVPANMQGQVEGSFPSFIPKTDEERVQNLGFELQEYIKNGVRFEATIKIDGTSCTVYIDEGKLGICSRNQRLKINEENANNLYVRVAREVGLFTALENYGSAGFNVAVQGEIFGEGVQGNKEKIKGQQFAIFKVWNIDTQSYLSPEDRKGFVALLRDKGYTGTVAPVLAENATLTELGITDIDSALAYAEGPSIYSDIREGVVFKSEDGKHSFKAISNEWLLKYKE